MGGLRPMRNNNKKSLKVVGVAKHYSLHDKNSSISDITSEFIAKFLPIKDKGRNYAADCVYISVFRKFTREYKNV